MFIVDLGGAAGDGGLADGQEFLGLAVRAFRRVEADEVARFPGRTEEAEHAASRRGSVGREGL
jgi:hypothetical protein